ncbi:MAG: hypothetical protein IPO08_22155 [Xanthomonadales bacterium]|nr:hypothetical protein [Xanthomonadales bacterium]
MANNNAPFGFVCAKHGGGGTPGRYAEKEIATGLAVNIFEGDIVKTDATLGITVAAATDGYLGVFKGVRYVDSNGDIKFANKWVSGTTLKSGTRAWALIDDDPFSRYIVQTSGTIADTDVGRKVDLVATAGDSLSGRSRFSVGSPGSKTQFRVERIVKQPQRVVDAGNNTTGYQISDAGQYAIVEVSLALQEIVRGTEV